MVAKTRPARAQHVSLELPVVQQGRRHGFDRLVLNHRRTSPLARSVLSTPASIFEDIVRLRSVAPAVLLAVATTLVPLTVAAAAEPTAARSTDVVCPAGSVPEDGFNDVGAGSAHEPAVDCIVWWRIAQGQSSNEYGASFGVSRAAMSTFIAGTIESAGGSLPAEPEDAFSDDDGGTHELRTNQLAAVGIVAGTGGGAYSPSRTVTRGQMAKFLALAAEFLSGEELPSGGDRFSDDDGTPFEPFIDQIAEAGVTGGSADGTYRADATVSREQMGSFLSRTLDLLVTQGQPASARPRRTSPFTGASFDAGCPSDRVQSAGYTDTADDPYRDAIDCVTHWGVMFGTRADTFAPRTLFTRDQGASFAANLFYSLGGTRPESVPDAYVDDEDSVHEDNANLLAAIGAAPVDENRWFRPQDVITVHELNGFLDGVYAARSGGERPFSSDTKDRPVVRAELAAELAAYLSAGVEDGYAAVP
jgi:hypothetical protein